MKITTSGAAADKHLWAAGFFLSQPELKPERRVSLSRRRLGGKH